MLRYFSTVYDFRKINSQAYIIKTYHEGDSLPIGIFVLQRIFPMFIFLTN